MYSYGTFVKQEYYSPIFMNKRRKIMEDKNPNEKFNYLLNVYKNKECEEFVFNEAIRILAYSKDDMTKVRILELLLRLQF